MDRSGVRLLNGRDVVLYSAGSFGTGVFQTIPTVLLLYYCTETLHIAAAIAGLLILTPKIVSIIWDPFVGARSDRFRHRWGRRRPFMAAGLVGMNGALLMLFAGPALSTPLLSLWVGGSYLLLTLSCSLFAVPYLALPAQLAGDGRALERLVASRMLVVMVGILAGAAVGPWLVSAGGSGRDGYRLMSGAIASVCAIVMAMPILMLGGGRDVATPSLKTSSGALPFARDMGKVVGDVGFRRLALTYLLQATAFGSFSALIPYIVTKGFGRSTADIGVALGIYLLATLAAVPLWAKLGNCIGWHRTMTLAAVFYAVGEVGVGSAELAGVSWPLALACFAVAGVPFAGLQVAPFTMLGLLVRQRGTGDEGSFTGVWTATEKLGLAFGPAGVALALAFVGTQNATAIVWIAMLLPSIVSLLSLNFNRALK